MSSSNLRDTDKKGIVMKILLIDGHALFREGLHHILQQLPDGVRKILEAENFHDGLNLTAQHPDLDLVLLEIKSPGSEGAISVKHFHKLYPRIPLVVLSSEEDYRVIKEVLNYGADGFVCKSSTGSTLLSALNLVLGGSLYVPQQLLHPTTTLDENKNIVSRGRTSKAKIEFGLTSRQMDVLRCLAGGLSNKEIGETINLAEGTVKVHVAAVYQTLGVGKRIEAVQIAKHLGLIEMSHA